MSYKPKTKFIFNRQIRRLIIKKKVRQTIVKNMQGHSKTGLNQRTQALFTVVSPKAITSSKMFNIYMRFRTDFWYSHGHLLHHKPGPGGPPGEVFRSQVALLVAEAF